MAVREPSADAVTSRPISHADGTKSDDRIAVEEPLEIRVAGEIVAVTMRTPGDDVALALGFLFAEGVLRGIDDVGTALHCGRVGDEGYGNAIEVTPAPGAHVVLKRIDSARRGTLTTAACGICGRQTIDDLLAACGDLEPGPMIARSLVARAPELLREHQPQFLATGGVHAAAILDEAGRVLSSAEDIGRHNAVDKTVGALLRARRLPARREVGAPAVLVVSGRASFEIVQKATVARLAAVVSVSAASSLAVDLSQRVGLTLVGFTRGGTWTVYAHPERLAP